MIRIFKGTDTVFTSNGDKILKPLEAIIYKNAEEEYIEIRAPILDKIYLVQDNILIVDTVTGKKGYRIHNPEYSKEVYAKGFLIWQENTPYAADREVTISYGKNLKECESIEDWDEVVTKIIPVGFEDKTLPEGYLEATSPHQRVYERSIEFDLSAHLEEVIKQIDEDIDDGNSQLSTLEKSKVSLQSNILMYEDAIETLNTERIRINARINILGDGEAEFREKEVLELQLAEVILQAVDMEDEKEASEQALADTIEEIAILSDNLVSLAHNRQNIIITDLRAQAQTYLNNNLYPHVNYTIKSHLEGITELGDTVRVKHERMGIDMMAYVTAYEYNLITNKYQLVEFGTNRVNFRSYINELESRVYSATKGVDTVSTLIEQLNDQIVLKIDDNGRIGLFRLGRDSQGTEVLIKADNIRFEGLVTANGFFKILEDGSIEAVNGKFTGAIEALTGHIAGFSFTDDKLSGGLYYNKDGKFFRVSPLSSYTGDGKGGQDPQYATIDLGTVEVDGSINTNVHIRNDGYMRLGLVREIGLSLRFLDFLNYIKTGGAKGTDTVMYSQNFQIGTDGKVHINSDDIPKPLKSIDITKSSDQITKLDITYEDDTTAEVDVEYNSSGEITKIGSTVINY